MPSSGSCDRRPLPFLHQPKYEPEYEPEYRLEPNVISVPLKFSLDLLVWSLVVPFAFVLRLNNLADFNIKAIEIFLVIGFFYKSALIFYFKLHLQLWQRTSLLELRILTFACLTSFVISAVLSFYISGVPRSVPLIAELLAVLGMTALRITSRVLHENSRRKSATEQSNKRVLIVGGGDAGSLVIREMFKHPEQNLSPLAILDDNPQLRGKWIQGVRVLGSLLDFEQVCQTQSIDMVVFAIPSASGKTVRQVVSDARRLNLEYKIFPGLYEIFGDHVQVSHIRDVNVEDLLRRSTAPLNLEQISGYLEGKTVLITGAGGSIGSEVVRQICHFHPKKLILLGRGENSIFSIQQEMLRTWPEIEQVALIGDVRDRARVREIFAAQRPQVVFHAAAHKHVPLMEESPHQAVLNNIFGTQNVAETALEFGVERMVNISSDKAVNPTSVMGTSKRVAEMIVTHCGQQAKTGQAFVSVRFGNVLGSRGSVVPTFMRQIRDGGPVTVTHPEMTRYFMTIPEASRLVLQAGALAQNGRIYVLDMGDPVKIMDLARDVITLSGARDVDIAFSGIRPGEKLYEELLTAAEGTSRSQHNDILVARSERPDGVWLYQNLEQLQKIAQSGDQTKLRHLLKEMVPESLIALV
jgi:FlaA1/EpsC-like NDP-sugar epimerase